LEDKLLKSDFDQKLKNNTIKTCPTPVHLTEQEKHQITEVLQLLSNKKNNPSRNQNQAGSCLFNTGAPSLSLNSNLPPTKKNTISEETDFSASTVPRLNLHNNITTTQHANTTKWNPTATQFLPNTYINLFNSQDENKSKFTMSNHME
jgi:hypothetical protein